jgi:hypothetical protein
MVESEFWVKSGEVEHWNTSEQFMLGAQCGNRKKNNSTYLLLSLFMLTALEFILVRTKTSVLQKLSAPVNFESFILWLRLLVCLITGPNTIPCHWLVLLDLLRLLCISCNCIYCWPSELVLRGHTWMSIIHRRRGILSNCLGVLVHDLLLHIVHLAFYDVWGSEVLLS